jgi:Fe-S cluster assembly scaffold protein SufB
MNTIIIDKENIIDIKDNAVELNINVEELTINIEGRVLINEIRKLTNEKLNLTINMKEGSSLTYNRFMINSEANINITTNQYNKSTLIFNYSILANDESTIDFISNINGNDNITEINIKGVTEQQGKLKITSTAKTKEKINNNNLQENIKVLLLNDEESVIIPNLLVSSNEIEVNHAATISGIDQNYLFYLNSKGISSEASEKLIKKGYLIGNLDTTNELRERMGKMLGGE